MTEAREAESWKSPRCMLATRLVVRRRGRCPWLVLRASRSWDGCCAASSSVATLDGALREAEAFSDACSPGCWAGPAAGATVQAGHHSFYTLRTVCLS